jgi:hypothetical protein
MSYLFQALLLSLYLKVFLSKPLLTKVCVVVHVELHSWQQNAYGIISSELLCHCTDQAAGCMTWGKATLALQPTHLPGIQLHNL